MSEKRRKPQAAGGGDFFDTLYMATGAFLSIFWFCFFSPSISSFRILWVASIVDLPVFCQPGSVTAGVTNCHDCRVFESQMTSKLR